MLCLKKRRTYSFSQGSSNEKPKHKRRSASSRRDDDAAEQRYNEATVTLPRKNGPREERGSGAMVLTVTEDTPADMLAGSMELLVQMPRDHHVQQQRVTVQRSTPMMDLLVQIATAHKLAASSYTLQAIGERGALLQHQPNTPIGALDALQVKLLPKQGTFLTRKSRQTNQPFETTFRLQVHLPRNQLYVSRVSPKTNLGEILDEVCREKNLDRAKYELRHPANLAETLDTSLSLQDYHLQEVTLYPRLQQKRPSSASVILNGGGSNANNHRNNGTGLSSQDIMALQKQEECRRQQARQSVFGFMFKKSKESSLSTDSLGNRSVSPAHSDETDARSTSPVIMQQPQQKLPARPIRKRRPAPKPPTVQQQQQTVVTDSNPASESGSAANNTTTSAPTTADKVIISHSRNSSDSSGYHEASVLSDNLDGNGGLQQASSKPETLPRRGRMQGILEAPRKLAHTAQTSKSLGNLAMASSQHGTLSRGISNTSISSAGQRKKRAAPPPPIARLPSAISAQGLERIVDSDESLTSDMELSKPSSDIDLGAVATGSNSKASSDIACHVVPIAEQPEPSSMEGDDGADHDAAIVATTTLTSACETETTRAVESARLAKKAESSQASSSSSTVPAVTAPVPKPRVALPSSTVVDAPEVASIAASSAASPPDSTQRNDLPSLTEDERQEIALAIDSIVQAARCGGQIDDDSLLSSLNDMSSTAEVFAEVPEAFRDDKFEDCADVEDVDTASKVVTFELETAVAEDDEKMSLSCAVISTIPKCEHLESIGDMDRVIVCENAMAATSSPKKRNKIVRSQSEMSRFDFGPSEKHGRHLTSNGEAFTFALNQELVVAEAAGKRIEAALIAAAEGKSSPTDTDILLQRVSDTLSHQLVVPPSPPPTPNNTTNNDEDCSSLDVPNFTSEPDADSSEQTALPRGFESCEKELLVQIKCIEEVLVEAIAKESTSTPLVERSKTHRPEESGTSLNSSPEQRKDTSDYVSGEDLSVTDWDYQIPAPPSAFRDDHGSAAVGDREQKEVVAVRASREPISIEAEIHHRRAVDEEEDSRAIKPILPHPPATSDEVDYCHSTGSSAKPSQLSSESTELKKEVISELETRISGSRPIVEPAAQRDEAYAPKIAPAENNLSNFTITTYSRKKSLDIFEPMGQQQSEAHRVLNTFATLTRGKSLVGDYAEARSGSGGMKGAQSMERVSVPLVDERAKFAERSEAVTREKPVHRSKSYIILTSNEKFQNRVNEAEQQHGRADERCDAVDGRAQGVSSSKKFTSTTNLVSSTSASDEVPRHKEKFSQWRDNILKRQEEIPEEKQLQSLQVLKSILPQLKSAQAPEDNSYKNSSDTFNATTKRQESRLSETVDAPIVTSTVTSGEVQMRINRRQHEPSKRYTYGGPPAVSLGSWSERPCVNVQIKTDTDYKFGGKNNGSSSASGPRTVVNLNGGGVEAATAAVNAAKVTNGAATSVKDDDEPRVDTTSVNFRELTKAFGQSEVRMRPKPTIPTRNSLVNRHSEYFERPKQQPETVKQNGFADSHMSTTTFGGGRATTLSNGGPAQKRYTSIVGITSSNNNAANNNVSSTSHQANFRFANGQVTSSSNTKQQAATTMTPAFKAFNQNGHHQPKEQKKDFVVPKPPTMPIITGVTLKSVNARSKSSPPMIQADPRDQLLESIRNFGTRGKLRSVADKC